MNANSYRYRQPAEILQNLIRFDTTNPPGKEAECIDYINRLIQSAGIDPMARAETLELGQFADLANLLDTP